MRYLTKVRTLILALLLALPLPAADWFSEARRTPPFSFHYANRSSRALLPAWKLTESARGATRLLRYLDPKTGLQLDWELTEYADFRSPAGV
jgi:hypothetical protein